MTVLWNGRRAGLDEQFAQDIDDLLAPSPFAWSVTFGFRSFAAQDALYQKHLAGGPLAAPPGHSAHEHGLAVDVAELVPSGVATHECWDTSRPAWPWLWAAVKASARLHSGHDFPPVAPADDDHIQAVKWYAVRDELKAQGKW